jgi:hypothetical protein
MPWLDRGQPAGDSERVLASARKRPATGYDTRPMDPANNAEHEALQRNAQELRKELGLDQPFDRLDLLRH